VPAVVKPGDPGIGVTGKELDIFERRTLDEQISDGCDPKRMRRDRRQLTFPISDN
jgi:hypothetical protein